MWGWAAPWGELPAPQGSSLGLSPLGVQSSWLWDTCVGGLCSGGCAVSAWAEGAASSVTTRSGTALNGLALAVCRPCAAPCKPRE